MINLNKSQIIDVFNVYNIEDKQQKTNRFKHLKQNERQAFIVILDAFLKNSPSVNVDNASYEGIKGKIKTDYVHKESSGFLIGLIKGIANFLRLRISSASLLSKHKSIQEKLDLQKKLETVTEKLDSEFQETQAIARSLTKSSLEGSKIDIPLDKVKEVNEKVDRLENQIKERYGKDLSNLTWHGRTSFQRILWQDENFVRAISDPLIVKAILLRKQQKKELVIGNGNTLSSLMLYGLGSSQSRLSYLVTASPNWKSSPLIKGISWNSLKVMGGGKLKSLKETPRKVSNEFLDNISNALKTMKDVLGTFSTDEIVSEEVQEVHRQISEASVGVLIEAIHQLVNNDDKVNKLTHGEAGKTTLAFSMAEQCLEVMTNYPALLKHHGDDHAAVLGYGLVSHALDARHLLAALFLLENPKSETQKNFTYYKGNRLDTSKEILRNLIDDLKNNRLNPEGQHLFKIRLQQIMQIILENRTKLGVTVDEIRTALTPKAS